MIGYERGKDADNNNREAIIGFYQIKKLQRSKTFPGSLFDIDILLVTPEDWTDEDNEEADRVFKGL